MATVNKWSNVAIAMQSAIAATKTITAITKANPASCTSVAHGYSTGDYVYLLISGMYQLQARVFRITVSSVDVFTLDSTDSTLFSTFSSGTAAKLTFGTTFGTVTTLNGSGGDFDFIDTTTVHDAIKTQVPGIASPLTYSFENIWDVADTGLIAMKAASDLQAQRAFRFTFATGAIVTFSGYVGCSLVPIGSAQDKVTTPAVITAYGALSAYAS